MLVQTAVLRVPDTQVTCRQDALRGPGFALSRIASQGLVTDWGAMSRLVAYIGRQTRSQLSIVLAGRGYVGGRGGVTLLAEGDVVTLDQRRHDDEGYAGSPCEVLVIEWDEGGPFGARHDGPPHLARIGRADVAHLRALTARLGTTPGASWLGELLASLRALGLGAPRHPDWSPEVPARTAAMYRAIGETRTLLPAHPSITELADALGVSERHVRRGFDELVAGYGLSSTSWRDLLSDMRLSWAHQLLSIPALPVRRVAALSGFRSSVALVHAFSTRGAGTPGQTARDHVQRWG